MQRNITGLILAGVITALALAAMNAPAGAGADPKPAFQPALPLERLMEGQGQLYKHLKEAVLDGKAKEARTYAWILAELANVNRQHAKSPRYDEFASTMSRECARLADLLKGRDTKPGVPVVSEIGKVCESCHNEFAKKKE
ncbi:MAG: hypothetical protein L6Q92_11905 [Phycisphaerae bacterium]|nr:hypothetical protein [Phycisphaerae bacterium]